MAKKTEKSKDKLDVFKEAQQEFIKDMVTPLVKDDLSNETKEELTEEITTALGPSQTELANMHTEEGDKWDNLAKYVNDEGAERLMNELKGMPGKDFVRNYLKVLEHFKPKLTRSEISPEDETDRTINIQIVQKLDDGSVRLIDVEGKTIESDEETDKSNKSENKLLED